MKSTFLRVIPVALMMLLACNNDPKPSNDSPKKATATAGMELVSNDVTGFDFENTITEDWQDNIISFDVMYEGGGVAIGDINNDGLSDVYFSGNMVADKLYLNQGDMKFKDITEEAGIDNDDFWSAGVSMVDVNADGLLDIYICRGGYRESASERTNILYVNQGEGKFLEQAEFRGLNDAGYSVMSNFFDADNDGDLDCYIINRPNHWRNKLAVFFDNKENPKKENSDQLYINDGKGFFTNETEKRGINSFFNFGLSVTTADLNNDNLTDIYIANDYQTSDQCYINQGNGYFKESIKEITNHIAYHAMGSDIADLDGDGNEDIYTVEMLPSDYWRAKVTMAPMVSEEKFQNYFVKLGLHVQYMHNNFQWNRGNGYFSEISQKLGINKTDWSWACIMEDFDNDGLRDLFVTNGYKRDMFDNDALMEIDALVNEAKKDPTIKQKKNITEFLKVMPSNPLANIMFKNYGDWKFEDVAKDWGMDEKTFSNGAAFGDLDNDGDLDLVINNIDGQPMLYKNKVEGNNYIRLKLNGGAKNPFGLGAKVKVTAGDKTWFEQFKVVRGFFSSMEPIMHIGIGDVEKIDHIQVVWTDQTVVDISDVEVNQTILVNIKGAKPYVAPLIPKTKIAEVKDAFSPQAEHRENYHKDYENQVLLPHKLSHEGPALCAGDLNGDGKDDFYIGGSTGYVGSIYLADANGKFVKKNNEVFARDKYHEDVDATFIDVDGDQDLDLYVVSGGSEFPANSEGYMDRVYINNGRGEFSIANALPKMGISGGCVEAGDFNSDGRQDIFLGTRIVPEFYPFPGHGVIMRNTGKNFEDVTQLVAPELLDLGMITDAKWVDLNGDDQLDLVVVGEWMPVKVFIQKDGKFKDETEAWGTSELTGWWFSIAHKDLDGDGDQDLIVGNLGKNYKHKASKDKPFHVYSDDFDKNGTYDVVLAKYDGDKQVPVRGRECTSQQLPGILDEFPTYRAFAEAGIDKILANKDDKTLHLKVHTFESYILENVGGKFEARSLPFEAQLSTIRSIDFADIDGDKLDEIIIGGNMFPAEPETSRADASIGVVLKQNKGVDYQPVSNLESGLFIPYDVREIRVVNSQNGKGLLVASNDDKVRFYSLN